MLLSVGKDTIYIWAVSYTHLDVYKRQDMRKSIDGLCAVVKDQLNMNPSRPNAIYLFCGRDVYKRQALTRATSSLESNGFNM